MEEEALTENQQDICNEELDDNQENFDEEWVPPNTSAMESINSATRAESAQILSRRFAQRDQVKQNMIQEEKIKRAQKEKRRKMKIQKWQEKTQRSPFKVNLVADNERLDEENRIRIQDEVRKTKKLDKRKKQVKNEIILKAIAESSDLEALRREKRAIMEEEKRLKALLDLEKTNSCRKMDMLAAQSAEKHRKQAKAEYRRQQRKQECEQRDKKYKELLKMKLSLND